MSGNDIELTFTQRMALAISDSFELRDRRFKLGLVTMSDKQLQTWMVEDLGISGPKLAELEAAFKAFDNKLRETIHDRRRN